MKWWYLFLLIRLFLAEEKTSRANIAFVPQTPIVLADSIELIEIAVPFPKPLDIDWGAFKHFSKFFKKMEICVWRITQWGYCRKQKLNGILENSQNTLIASLRKDISEFEEEKGLSWVKMWRFLQTLPSLEQEQKVNNVAGSGSCCWTWFGAHNRKNSLQNALHLSSLSGLRREGAPNCKSLGPPGLRATPYTEPHRWHNTHPGQRKFKTAGTNENYLELYSWELRNRRESH